MHEIETKILDVDPHQLESKLIQLGGEKIQDAKLVVDWFGPKEIYGQKEIIEGQDPWFLRIRKYSTGKAELTWKGKSEILGASRKHKEINFELENYDKTYDFLESIGLVNYAHQEKFRKSFILNNWQFDLDQYPNMPAYLEIEGQSEESIQEAIKLLGVESYKACSEGERKLIQEEYKLNWYNMKFKS